MQHSGNSERDLSTAFIDVVGGEPLAGSGFENEKPEPNFPNDELEGEQA